MHCHLTETNVECWRTGEEGGMAVLHVRPCHTDI